MDRGNYGAAAPDDNHNYSPFPFLRNLSSSHIRVGSNSTYKTTSPSEESYGPSDTSSTASTLTGLDLDTPKPSGARGYGVKLMPGVVNPSIKDHEIKQFNVMFPTPITRPFNKPWTPNRPSIPAIPTIPTIPRATPTQDDGFVPMNRWPTYALGDDRLLHPIWKAQLAATGISKNYGGNIFLPANQSAPIPDGMNTSLWLTNLPPNCTHQQLLGAIRGCGKIYATVINPPEAPYNPYEPKTTHTTSASKLVFFDRGGVERLVAKAQTGAFAVGGYVPRVRPNRIKSAPREPGPQCRVLHIEGPSAIVNERFLNDFFQMKFKYELESVITLGTHGTITRQEWRFGSFRCQAESARQSIAREKDRRNLPDIDHHLWSQVMVHFGVDPCA